MNGTLQMGQVSTTSYLEIQNMGSDNLGLDGDLVPYASVTFDLGNNSATEHWDGVVANTYTTFSDRRTKNQIRELNYGLREVMQLKPVSYKYNANISANDRTRLGLIAQDVEEVIPEVVISEDVDIDKNGNKVVTKGEFKVMNYMDLIPVLIKAIQEQEEKINQLEEKIKVLENQN